MYFSLFNGKTELTNSFSFSFIINVTTSALEIFQKLLDLFSVHKTELTTTRFS